MDMNAATDLCIELMERHGLTSQGWSFHFDTASRRFGACHYGRRKITMSASLTALNSEARVRNTILHEIAHALVARSNGHNEVWRRKAIEIGCDGERCYSSAEVVTPAARYVGECPGCGITIRRNILPKRDGACRACCRKVGGFDPRFIIRYRRAGSAPTSTPTPTPTPPVAPQASADAIAALSPAKRAWITRRLKAQAQAAREEVAG